MRALKGNLIEGLPVEVNQPYTTAALFDLDHTLLSVNSSFQFGKFLYRHHFFSFSRMISLASFYVLHKGGMISIETLHRKIFRQLFLGKSKALFVEQAERFVKCHLSQLIYQPAIEELRSAILNGSYVAILSSSPDFLVSIFAKELGIAHWDATEYAVDDDGKFSHISQFLSGDKKSDYCKQCAEKLHIDVLAITAYTDSILDLPLLETAGCKIAVRPDKKLLSLCKRNQWRVI